MRTVDEIKRLLSDRRLTQIAQATGLHRNTLARIRSGQQPNPTYYILAKLDAYFDGQAAQHE